MTGAATTARLSPFVHEAFFYRDDDDYLAGTVTFIRDGLRADEPVLVAVPADRLRLIQAALSDDERQLVTFAAMEDLGRNPAWIIPAWSDFVAPLAEEGRAARGIGEPIWYGRSDEELVECARHEALLNLAFADAAGFTLLCPYDATRLGDDVLDEAYCNHPHVSRPGCRSTSDRFVPEVPPSIDTPLEPAPPWANRLAFDARSLGDVRRRVEADAVAAGLDRHRVHEVVVAASEAASNSIRHGGGSGELTTWSDGSRFLCDVVDNGRIHDPLAGRVRPTPHQVDGRGLWIMNQLCDLVQIRSSGRPTGLQVRLHVRR